MQGNPIYPPLVWRLFRETPGAGRLPETDPAVVHAEAGSRAADARLRLWVRWTAERVEAARFEAFGCPVTLAVGAWLTQALAGRTRVEVAALDAAALRAALEIPEARIHCALIGEDAVRALLARLPEVNET
jgi:NifU homolog involved in Fe-S cluster formation